MNRIQLKIIITASIALMFSMIAFNNITDYNTNFEWVEGLLKMETLTTKNLEWRAITNSTLHHLLYSLIIGWEALTGLVCWCGAYLMLRTLSCGKSVATAGITMGFALFMFGFVIVGGEWFYMWDSTFRSMHTKAILLSFMLGSFAFFVSSSD